MNIETALKLTGFVLCEFDGSGVDCVKCETEIGKFEPVYYESTCYESDEGEYYCENCTIDTPSRWEREQVDAGD